MCVLGLTSLLFCLHWSRRLLVDLLVLVILLVPKHIAKDCRKVNGLLVGEQLLCLVICHRLVGLDANVAAAAHGIVANVLVAREHENLLLGLARHRGEGRAF